MRIAKIKWLPNAYPTDSIIGSSPVKLYTGEIPLTSNPLIVELMEHKIVHSPIGRYSGDYGLTIKDHIR